MIQVGDKTKLRCPRCKSATFSIFERFNVYDLLSIVDGELTCIDGAQRPEATGDMFGECDSCHHKWRLRTSVNDLAVEPQL